VAGQARGAGDQHLHLRFRQRLGQAGRQAGAVEQRRGVVGPEPLAAQESVELPERRQPTRRGARRQAGVGQGAEVIAQGVRPGGGGLLHPGAAGEGGEVQQVGAVGGERVGRRAALGGQHLQEGFEVAAGGQGGG
jgi:hypothetical protein